MAAVAVAAVLVASTALLLPSPPLSAAPLTGAGAPAQNAGADWPAYLFGPSHSSYSAAETTITKAAAPGVTKLGQWKAPAPTKPGQPQPTFNASPTVVGDIVYIGTESGVFYALNYVTGRIVWQHFVGFEKKMTCSPLGVTATATVVPDPVTSKLTVYVAGGDGYLYALDAPTGAVDWRSVVGLPSSTVNDYYNWGSPLVAGGNVYMGISSSCDNPLVPGGLKEYSQSTGGLEATHDTLAGGALGGSIWSSPGVASDGSVIVTTGNSSGTTNMAGSDSVTRLDPSTLAVEDTWQVPLSEQVTDSDFGGSPTMFQATLNGVPTPMVGACNKNGTYYAFRQGDLAGGPVWTYQMGDPYKTDPGESQCDAAAIWDGTQLIEGANGTDINGVHVQGSVRSLDPATGTPLWQRGLPGQEIGSPSENGAGVVAASVFVSTTGQLGVYLLDASTGRLLRTIQTSAPVFAQPVFAHGRLFLAGASTYGLAVFK